MEQQHNKSTRKLIDHKLGFYLAEYFFRIILFNKKFNKELKNFELVLMIKLIY